MFRESFYYFQFSKNRERLMFIQHFQDTGTGVVLIGYISSNTRSNTQQQETSKFPKSAAEIVCGCGSRSWAYKSKLQQ